MHEVIICCSDTFLAVKYVDLDRGEFNTELFLADIPVAVRALDNVIDRASVWPMDEQEAEMKAKRRIGLGITGLANALEALGCPYGSPSFVKGTEMIMRNLRDGAYRASINLAKEKGAFPLFDADPFLSSGFAERLPQDIRDGISESGIRNSHLIAIAPTGTISLTADNVSSGLEPVFAHRFNRTIHLTDGEHTESVEDYGVRIFGVEGRTASELSPMEHLDVLAACQPFVDQSISKTINVPTDIAWEDFKDVYMQAWKRGTKGATTFRPGGQRLGILIEPEEEEASSCGIDEVTGRRECS